jgi:ribonuclease-3
MRARIVSREQLNEIALRMGLQFHVVAQNKISSTKNIYGNALEAIIGALYIDKGYEKTKSFILKKIIDKNIDLKELALTDSDYKSQVIEWTQKNKVEIVFNDEEVESTEQNNLYFTSTIVYENQILGQGRGLSKKEAQQNASREALEKTKQIPVITL